MKSSIVQACRTIFNWSSGDGAAAAVAGVACGTPEDGVFA